MVFADDGHHLVDGLLRHPGMVAVDDIGYGGGGDIGLSGYVLDGNHGSPLATGAGGSEPGL